MIHAAALFTLAAAGPLLPQMASADAGAIAYDAQGGAFGAAWRAASVDTAAEQAMRECVSYGGDCAPVLAFVDGCGALASGPTAHAAKTGADVAGAERAALAACGALDQGGCAIVVSFCSDR